MLRKEFEQQSKKQSHLILSTTSTQQTLSKRAPARLGRNFVYSKNTNFAIQRASDKAHLASYILLSEEKWFDKGSLGRLQAEERKEILEKSLKQLSKEKTFLMQIIPLTIIF